MPWYSVPFHLQTCPRLDDEFHDVPGHQSIQLWLDVPLPICLGLPGIRALVIQFSTLLPQESHLPTSRGPNALHRTPPPSSKGLCFPGCTAEFLLTLLYSSWPPSITSSKGYCFNINTWKKEKKWQIAVGFDTVKHKLPLRQRGTKRPLYGKNKDLGMRKRDY